jgi:Tfp pilus assembly protein PilF
MAVVLWAAGLAGCESLHSYPPNTDLLADGDRPAVKLKPAQAADVQFSLGRSLEKRGQTGQAAVAYEEALKNDPMRDDACLRLAVLKDQQGDFAASAELFHRALKAKPGSSEIFCSMGYSCYLQHRWADAEMNLKQALALNKDNRRAHNNLGLVLAHTGRPADALLEFRKGGCAEADAQANVAFFLTLDHHWAEARAHYERARAADPSSVAARQGLQELDALVTKDAPVVAARTTRDEPPRPVETADWKGGSPYNPIPGTPPVPQSITQASFEQTDRTTPNQAAPVLVATTAKDEAPPPSETAGLATSSASNPVSASPRVPDSITQDSPEKTDRTSANEAAPVVPATTPREEPPAPPSGTVDMAVDNASNPVPASPPVPGATTVPSSEPTGQTTETPASVRPVQPQESEWHRPAGPEQSSAPAGP